MLTWSSRNTATGKTTLQEENFKGRPSYRKRTLRKDNLINMQEEKIKSTCLACKTGPELGTAQPQLVRQLFTILEKEYI